MTSYLRVFSLTCCALLCAATVRAESPVYDGATFAAHDTLAPETESRADAKACLDGLVWETTDFQVCCVLPTALQGDWKVRFPTPLPSGEAANDQVTMEWYVAKDENEQPLSAPAVVVVHESGSGMTIGRIMARSLRQQGFHAFMVQLPYYGDRRSAGGRPRGEKLFSTIRQAVADVRRARDAVTCLPHVKTDNISLQGTSLGGFVAATAGSLDRSYHRVFIMLAGGNLYDVIQKGEKDAAKLREELAAAGIAGDKLRSLLSVIEPTRVAHRLDPKSTWLYSAMFDRVVPPANAHLLASTAGLDASHHVEILTNHYSGVVFLPYILSHMREQIAPQAARLDDDSESRIRSNAQGEENDN